MPADPGESISKAVEMKALWTYLSQADALCQTRA